MNRNYDEILETLKYYIEESRNERNHIKLIKDKKPILYPAVLLEREEKQILKYCLQIFENFVANENIHQSLLCTFGVYESLEAFAIRMRNDDEKLCKRATEITEILRNSAPPAHSTRSCTRRTIANKKQHTIYLLHIEELTNKNRKKFENSLLKLKGIISFLINMEHKRCTLRICPNLTIDAVVNHVIKCCNWKPLIVTKNRQDGVESLYDITEKLFEKNKSFIEYFDENELSPQNNKAIAAAIRFAKSGNTVLKSISEFWNNSFYW